MSITFTPKKNTEKMLREVRDKYGIRPEAFVTLKLEEEALRIKGEQQNEIPPNKPTHEAA